MTSRARQWVTLGILASACVGFVACALDESGTSDAGPDADIIDSSPVDQTVDVPEDVPQLPDVSNDLNSSDADASDAGDADASDASDAADVVTTCEIDASCVATIPDGGWTLLGITTDGGACSLQSGTLLTDAQAAPSACACGCTTSGTPTCGDAIYAGYTDPSCGTAVVDGSVAVNGCVDVGDLVPDAGVTVAPGVVSGVSCDASVTGNQNVVAQQFGTCTATQCTDDYCGMKTQGFRLCIAHDPPVTSCPSGFPVRIDAVASASVSCNGCTCGVKNPACTGTVTTYDASACSDGGEITSFSATASCTALSDETLSISYAPNAPTNPTCSASTLGSSVDTLGSTVLCCSP